MGCLGRLFKLFCASATVFLGVLLGPNPLPESVKFSEFHVTPTKNLGEATAHNELLNNAERLFEDEIKGPEAFEVINGELYTSLHGGHVAKVFDDQVIPVVKFGQPCVGWWEESKCGRPLGIKAYGRDHIIVADAYFGIFKYNLNTRQIINLVNKDTVIDGIKPKLFNGVEVGRDGSIYWTHSSADFEVQDCMFTFLADGSGRLIKYDPVTQKNTVLLNSLYMANGLALSPAEDFILVSESGQSRILKYYLAGPKKSTSEVFIDGLPGVPDNLRQNGEGGFFIPLVLTRDEHNPAIFQVIAPFPSLRKFLARFLSIVELGLDRLQKIYPNYFIQRALHYVGHLESIGMILPVKTTVLEVDINGNVVKCYHGSDGSVTSISDVIVHNGYLYLGSPVNNYLARVKLSKLGDRQSDKYRRPEPSAPNLPPPPPPTTTARPPPPTTRAPPTTTRPPPPPTTRAPPPTTTAKPPPPPTTRPPPTTTKPPPTTRSPPSTTTKPPPPPTTRTPPPPTTRTPPSTTTKPPPPPTTRTPPTTTTTTTTTTRPPTPVRKTEPSNPPR